MNEKMKELREKLISEGVVKNTEEFGKWLGYDKSSKQIASDFCTGQRRVPDRLRLKLYRKGWIADNETPFKVVGKNGNSGITVIIFAVDGESAIRRFKNVVNTEYQTITAHEIKIGEDDGESNSDN